MLSIRSSRFCRVASVVAKTHCSSWLPRPPWISSWRGVELAKVDELVATAQKAQPCADPNTPTDPQETLDFKDRQAEAGPRPWLQVGLGGLECLEVKADRPWRPREIRWGDG